MSILPPPAAQINVAASDQAILGRRLAVLLAEPQHAPHHACGITRRPCRDCRRCAPLNCADADRCAGAIGPIPTGADRLCRPCAATWRCRAWRQHPRYVREYDRAVERYPALARLHPDRETAAALYLALRVDIRRDMRPMLARELPALIATITAPQE